MWLVRKELLRITNIHLQSNPNQVINKLHTTFFYTIVTKAFSTPGHYQLSVTTEGLAIINISLTQTHSPQTQDTHTQMHMDLHMHTQAARTMTYLPKIKGNKAGGHALQPFTYYNIFTFMLLLNQTCS